MTHDDGFHVLDVFACGFDGVRKFHLLGVRCPCKYVGQRTALFLFGSEMAQIEQVDFRASRGLVCWNSGRSQQLCNTTHDKVNVRVEVGLSKGLEEAGRAPYTAHRRLATPWLDSHIMSAG